MNKTIKRIGLALGLMSVVASAQALPTLFFDGQVDYTYDPLTQLPPGLLSVSGTLFETQDISPAPYLVDSSISFSALFVSSQTVSGSTPFSAKGTRGLFYSDPASPLTIFDGNDNLLLSANLNDLVLQGVNGTNFGSITAILQASGGSLMNMFDGADLFALQLNLTTEFSSSMFYQSFNGRVDGNITGQQPVPEPAMLALLGLGVLALGFVRKQTNRI